MATKIFLPSVGGVKIRRANVTTNGVDAAVDTNVKKQLVALNALLSKPIFWVRSFSNDNTLEKVKPKASPANNSEGMLPEDLLAKTLTPPLFWHQTPG
jgi:hypothetical protein